MNAYIEAPAYLQVEPDYNRWTPQNRRDTADAIQGGRVVAMTQNRPAKPKPGTVVVKVVLRIPKASFVPLRPEAVVTIPESMTDGIPVEVEVADPSEVD
ncbi:hypothetical protein GCM10009775_04350 [Microbacterium aoyamense]|uniref:Uncharacterized protein n=1 Tax=Microbacterium aoyamense TaxID=344166 RepID=A0ABP5AL66_9MICO|nr:hypothetical protein [Microbacterium aoyamense]